MGGVSPGARLCFSCGPTGSEATGGPPGGGQAWATLSSIFVNAARSADADVALTLGSVFVPDRSSALSPPGWSVPQPTRTKAVRALTARARPGRVNGRRLCVMYPASDGWSALRLSACTHVCKDEGERSCPGQVRLQLRQLPSVAALDDLRLTRHLRPGLGGRIPLGPTQP